MYQIFTDDFMKVWLVFDWRLLVHDAWMHSGFCTWFGGNPWRGFATLCCQDVPVGCRLWQSIWWGSSWRV